MGDAVTADVEFADSLAAINTHAAANDVDVYVYVTSSFRTSTVVPGAVVTPATMSNHLAGHAIDMNVKYGAGKTSWCNSTCLGGSPPAGVKEFIAAVRGDAGLRWGGDFTIKDPVHVDDGLNVNDAAAYTARHQATQQARTSGCG
ncbi:D-alanyl-D-alanine carboxypeptidase [Geodermatophilus aquaeductus]|uniref:D-alanyl-D-alanine carboxypeptidase n=1 Tax=Geodermatophilus aquaeductus TaxID=1564161 RepID=A0A521DY21_9ACTN|nr:D-alanyl-D-alanine carboxypeptidase [Geodermatophilus aquaeductus]